MKFVVGDHIRCIRDIHYFLTSGRSYITIDVCDFEEPQRIKLKDDGGDILYYSSSHFVLDVVSIRNGVIDEILK